MSERHLTVCDQCAREVRDPYGQSGWVRLEGLFRVSDGRRPDGQAKTLKYWSDGQRDFCCLKCLGDWAAIPDPVRP